MDMDIDIDIDIATEKEEAAACIEAAACREAAACIGAAACREAATCEEAAACEEDDCGEYGAVFYMTLPSYLSDDIIALEEGIKNNSSLLDCLYCEVQGSINAAFYNSEITAGEARFLREKHLGLV